MRTLKGCFVGLGLCLILIAMAMATPTSQLAASLIDPVADGINKFSAALFEAHVQSAPDNLLLSPLSAAIGLSMAAAGSGGNTKSQFKQVLNLPLTDKQTLEGYQSLIDDLTNIQYSKLLLANKLFIDKEFPIKSAYRNLTEIYYRSAADNINFHEPNDAAEIINTWIRDLTKDHPGHIRDIISPSDLAANTGLVLVNAIYFKGNWANAFSPEYTQQRPFRISKTSNKTVPIMYRSGIYKYGFVPGNNGRFIVLPFQKSELSMLIMLPNEVDGLTQLEEDIKKLTIAEILEQGSDNQVQLYLPKLRLRYKTTLDDVLYKLGLTDMFTTEANFKGISNGKLLINKIIQSNYIEIDENGSDDDVGGGVVTRVQAVQGKPKDFNVNHPFYYTIIRSLEGSGNKNTYVALHSGQVVEPKM